MQCCSWTITWQGFHRRSTEGTTILEGIKEIVKGNAVVTYDTEGRTKGDFDVITDAIGEDPYADTESDRIDNINIRRRDIDMH